MTSSERHARDERADAIISRACAQYVHTQAAAEPGPESPIEPSPEFESKMDGMLQRFGSPQGPRRRFPRRVATIAAVALVLLVVTMSLPATADGRPLFNYLFSEKEQTHVTLRNIAAYGLFEDTLRGLKTTDVLYVPTHKRFAEVIPVVEVVEDSGYLSISFVYTTPLETMVFIQQRPVYDTSSFDVEHGEVQKVDVGAFNGYMRSDGQDASLVWNDGTTAFTLHVESGEEVALEVATSLNALRRTKDGISGPDGP